ncbi:MAG TPA: glycosyltransferase family 39 protein [Nitrososphaerales archaeon]|nr:glycosyltransferase family 39 protein [Nitrososphaerales archaeon]
MLVTDSSTVQRPPNSWKRRAKYSFAASMLCLILAVAVVAINASSPDALLVAAAGTLGILWLVFGALALVFGLRHLLLSNPGLDKPIIVLTIMSLAIFAAHLYVSNSPSATTSGSTSGAVGTDFKDGDLSVNTTYNGQVIQFVLLDSGSNPISSVSVSLNGKQLPSNFTTVPSILQPLSDGESINASWTAPGATGQQLQVDYSYLSCYNNSSNTLGCIMDEVYYVPAALDILHSMQCAPYQDNCNLEHPFLTKALMAAGMAVFGTNDLGWKLANMILGTLCIPLLFVLVKRVSGNSKLAYFSSFLLSTDTMFFVHASAGLIDIPGIFFTLVGFNLYFWKSSFWKFDNLFASGILVGLAMLSKETGVFMLMALLSYHIYAGLGTIKKIVVECLEIAVGAGITFAAGLQVYASLFTSATVPTFIAEIQYILKYGGGLTGPGWYDSVLKSYITPLNWLTYYTPVSYLVTHITTTVSSASGTTTTVLIGVGYYGVTNPIVVWVVFAWVPVVIYGLAKRKAPDFVRSGDDKLGIFMLFWLAWGYIPYIFLWVYGRVTYPFYVLPVVPALAVGAAFFVTRSWFPRKMVPIYLAAAFIWFFIYFPQKEFLPTWLRLAIGR